MFQKKERKEQPRTVNYLWVLAGGYLVYLGVSLIYSIFQGEATSIAVNIAAAVLFIGVGGWVCLREWRVYRFGSKEEQEAMAKAQALEEAQAAEESGEEDT